MKNKLFLLLIAVTLIFLITAGTVLARGSDRVAICHFLGNGGYNEIVIDDDAVPAHVAHGDVYPVPENGCPNDNDDGDDGDNDNDDGDDGDNDNDDGDDGDNDNDDGDNDNRVTPTPEPDEATCQAAGALWALPADAEGDRFVGTNLRDFVLRVGVLEYADGEARLHQPFVAEISPSGAGDRYQIPSELWGEGYWYQVGCGRIHGEQELGLD